VLPTDIFKIVVDNAPLFAIDLVVVNESDELLVGKRLNAPAKDWWFVPGGRVFKNEHISDAFRRISDNELGMQCLLEQARLLGVFDHIYDDSVFDSTISTHYINAVKKVSGLAFCLYLFCSSVSFLTYLNSGIYGNRSEGSIGEDAFPNPANDYAVSKYSMELMGKLWSNTLPITFTRPFNYTGVGQSSDFLIPKIIDHFKAKRSIIELGNLDVWREFNDVRFIADSYVKLIEQASLLSGQAVNICTGKAYSLREVIALCEEISNHKIELHVNPQFVRANEVSVLKGSKKLLEQTIGSNTEYDLRQTLKWMLGIEK